MGKMLLHTCCGPCSIYCVEKLKQMNIQFELLWYNPNIHLYKEYEARRDTLIELYQNTDIKVNILDEYGLIDFCRNVANKEKERCTYCYTKRLEQTAKYAKENGFDSICTTLFVSPYQNHELIKKIGEKICKKYELKFEYIDFREGFRQGQNKARELGIYMQKYCGCIYSEQDRYQKQIEKDKERFLN
ncbi:MAG: epoxyqueuosine reductase QueH [Clostridiales bacterium]|nr:epoxyqueuosine reductase QueH [Clostridiales bacterium]